MIYKTIALITNINKEKAVKKSSELIKWLEKRNIKVKLAEEDAPELKCDNLACEKTDLLTDTDLIITLGGDGTVLRAVRLLNGKRIKILAVDFGKFGFLQEVAEKDLYDDLESVLGGKHHIEERSLLELNLNGKKHLVLNDFVISHDGFRIMHLKTYINGTFFYEYPADGLAVANPTGASAYSLSAGGPFVNPRAKVNILTPINPHSLMSRSIVLDSEDVLDIKVASINGNFIITGDGIDIHHGEPVDLQIKASEEKVLLVKLRPYDYFGFLRTKLSILCGVNGAD